MKKINIVDVLKPAEEIVTVTPENESENPQEIGQPAVRKLATSSEDAEQVTRWVASPEFRERQEKLKIPSGNKPILQIKLSGSPYEIILLKKNRVNGNRHMSVIGSNGPSTISTCRESRYLIGI